MAWGRAAAEAVRRRCGSDGDAARCGSTASGQRAWSADSADLKSASAAAGVGAARAAAATAAGEVGGAMEVGQSRVSSARPPCEVKAAASRVGRRARRGSPDSSGSTALQSSALITATVTGCVFMGRAGLG